MPDRQPIARWALNSGFSIFAITLALVLAQAGLGFGQQLLVAVLLIIGGSQLSRITAKSLPNFHWPMLAKGAGWVFLAAVLVNSNFVQKPLEAINVANEGLGGIDMSNAFEGCPGLQQISEYGDTFTLHKGCDEQLIKVPLTIDPWYVIGDSRFPGQFKHWARAKWHPTNGNLVIVDTIRWPERIDDDTVEVTVVSKEQAAEMMGK